MICKISARKKVGVDTASMDSTMMTLSIHLLWFAAAIIPNRMPMSELRMVPPTASTTVYLYRESSSAEMSLWVRSEVPRSPRSTPEM